MQLLVDGHWYRKHSLLPRLPLVRAVNKNMEGETQGGAWERGYRQHTCTMCVSTFNGCRRKECVKFLSLAPGDQEWGSQLNLCVFDLEECFTVTGGRSVLFNSAWTRKQGNGLEYCHYCVFTASCGIFLCSGLEIRLCQAKENYFGKIAHQTALK